MASYLALGGVNLILTQGNTILYFGKGIIRPLFGGQLDQYVSAPLLWWIGLAFGIWYLLDDGSVLIWPDWLPLLCRLPLAGSLKLK